MISKLKKTLSPYYTNLRGWRTDRKIVVIESDDWGSIRMPSKEVYEKCLKEGYRVDNNPYERYDSLASENDLEHLFFLLGSFKDINGNSPVITANILPANPDFDRIKDFEYSEYFYESITETFKNYPNHSRCFQLWREGMEKGVFFPQSHGREHLNVSLFMNALQQRNEDVLHGFDHRMPGSVPKNEINGKNKFVEALRYNSDIDKWNKFDITLEGLELFRSLIGYDSESFMPQNYLWSPDFDKKFYESGVKYLQGNRKMKEPGINGVKYHSHWLGKKNEYDQYYLIRNALFEPSLFRKGISDPVKNCLKNISVAFKMKKPAIICSHRLNYVGFIDVNNRDRNLKLMESLIRQILVRWPDVEFKTSVELGEAISE